MKYLIYILKSVLNLIIILKFLKEIPLQESNQKKYNPLFIQVPFIIKDSFIYITINKISKIYNSLINIIDSPQYSKR
ncbi:unnamed protein product [Paramecium sonneborni]|uniref:Uncharacterized protein n=1 Tax=Paramecium sonneborni TaxID=65129 RepID=A0A8S1NPG1_9CILI|nr:unnamed protein product [Paramecium sonneborni]